MLDHLGFGVSDLAASKAFFSAALAPLGYQVVMEVDDGIGIGIGRPMLWLQASPTATAHLHIAMHTDQRAVVDAFHRAALAAGGKDNGAPGLRPQYHPELLRRLCDRTGRSQR